MARKKESQGESVTVLEDGDIYFIYQPKVQKESAAGLGDVKRLYMVLNPRGKKLYRMMIIGEKKLPEAGEKGRKNWGFVEMIAHDVRAIEQELGRKTYRTKTRGERVESAARPVGEGIYSIARHGDHTHLVYVLELPDRPGDVQKEFSIEKEASHILSVKNPEKPSLRHAGLSEEKKADYPRKLQEKFGGKRFIPADPPDFLDYEGAELLLIGASEEISEELGIDLKPERETEDTAEIFRDLHMRKSEHPMEPLFRGEWA